MARRRFVIVDADTLAGWRRTTASLRQLHDAVADLRAQDPEALVAVVGDPSLKWALPEDEREELEEDVRIRAVVFAPAGSIGGHVGFIGQIAAKARAKDLDPIAVTDRAVADCRVAKVRREGDHFVFDLDGASVPSVVAPTGQHRRRRPKPSA